MKQSILGIGIVAAMLTACSNDETVSVVAKEAITFGRTFVENSTRAITDKTYGGGSVNLSAFNVYGTVTGENNNTVNIFDGDEVTYTSISEAEGTWNYTDTQYWIPGCSYKFIALVDAGTIETDNQGMPTSIAYDVTTQNDLLLAEANRSQEGEILNAEEISFSFNHLLAKAQFTFTNEFAAETGVNLTVQNIKITNAPKGGTYTIGTDRGWTVDNSETNQAEVDFGSSEAILPGGNTGTSGNAKVLLPGTYTFTITFTVAHNKGGSDTPKSFTTGEIELKAGHSYNFTANLNASNVEGVEPIKFNIITGDWSGDADTPVQY